MVVLDGTQRYHRTVSEGSLKIMENGGIKPEVDVHFDHPFTEQTRMPWHEHGDTVSRPSGSGQVVLKKHPLVSYI